MEDALRVVLGLVLASAAVAKAVRGDGARSGLAAVGVPARGVVAGWLALIGAEAAVAALLLSGAAPRPAGAAAALLGLAFLCGLALARARGARRVSCGCFGGTSERPLWLLAVRASAVTAGGVLIASSALPAGWPSRGALVLLALAALTLAVLGLGVALALLARQVGQLHLALVPRSALELASEGPPLGAAAPPLDGLERRGGELVLFGSAGCRLCRELEPALRAVARLRSLAIRPVGAESDPESLSRWAVPGTPYVVHVEDGIVAAKGLVNTREQLDGLVALGRERLAASA
jgi:hypothetical protein